MKLSDYIYRQVDGFNRAGKKIVRPQNDIEKIASRFVAIMLLLIVIAFYIFIIRLGTNIPLRIHIRTWIYFVPILSFVVMFYKGVSISWLVKGFLKYWMVPLMLVWVYLIVMNMFYVIFFGGDLNIMLIMAGFMSLYIGMMYGIYFWISGFRSFVCYLPALMMVGLFIGGLAMILWGTGVLDWFVVDVLGW